MLLNANGHRYLIYIAASLKMLLNTLKSFGQNITVRDPRRKPITLVYKI